jgi:hypothetical protein
MGPTSAPAGAAPLPAKTSLAPALNRQPQLTERRVPASFRFQFLPGLQRDGRNRLTL